MVALVLALACVSAESSGPEGREGRGGKGLIFVGIARCIALVLIRNDLAEGDGECCAVSVAFNSILQTVLFAPFMVFYVRVISRSHNILAVSYGKVATSVAIFLGQSLHKRSQVLY